MLFAAGYMLMAGTRSLWQLMLSYGVLAGVGFGATTPPMFGAIICRWFERRRGMAVSLAMAGSCLGQFVLIPPFTGMSIALGWRATSFWLGAAGFVLNVLLAVIVIRDDPVPMGIAPYGHVSSPASGAAVHASHSHGAADLSLRQAIRTRPLWLFAVSMFVCGGADFLVSPHLVPMVTDQGISTTTAANMLAWFGLLSLAGILLAGPASDAIGDRVPIAITFALRIALFLMIPLVQTEATFWIFSLGFGLTFLVTAPLTPTLSGRLFGFANIGLIAGFVTTIHQLGGGLWAYLGGAIYDATGSYALAFAITMGLTAVVLFCMLMLK